MHYDDHVSLSSEISQLERLLAEIPKGNVIDRLGLDARLSAARKSISGVSRKSEGYRARLTFRGKPVVSSYGIAADFASRATGDFTDAIAAVAVGLDETLRYMGPIPDKQKNQMLITGTTVGSFGFEFELPRPDNVALFSESTKAEDAVQKIQELFHSVAEGSDDEVAELVDEMHPRAVRKVADFLSFIAQQDAWCSLEFKERSFRFRGIDQLRSSVNRLREENIRESNETYTGEFQGVLPSSRTFEFKLAGTSAILKGKVGPDIEDPDVLNRDHLHKAVDVNLHAIMVGQGRPRYTLLSLDSISP